MYQVDDKTVLNIQEYKEKYEIQEGYIHSVSGEFKLRWLKDDMGKSHPLKIKLGTKAKTLAILKAMVRDLEGGGPKYEEPKDDVPF